MRSRLNARTVDRLNVGKVSQQCVELSLQGQNLCLFQFEARKSRDMPNFIEGDRHAGSLAQAHNGPNARAQIESEAPPDFGYVGVVLRSVCRAVRPGSRFLVRGPKFQVVTGVVGMLVLLGIAKRQFERYIPLAPSNPLAGSPAPFLQVAEHERIAWYPFSREIFGDARERRKPILFVVGAPWSELGRTFDKVIFTDPRIQKYLAKYYVCVRVDSTQIPAWRNNFLPLSRFKYGFLVGWQGWILNSKGDPIQFIGQTDGDAKVDATQVLIALIHGADVATGELPSGSVANDQQTDLAMISEGFGLTLPNFSAYNQLLASITHPQYGGFPTNNLQVLRPSVWLFQLLGGQMDALKRSLDPVLASSVVDWLDGGFFRLSTSADWQRVQTDKLAVENAEMMQMLATAAVATGNDLYRRLAVRTFDSLRSQFESEGLIKTCREGDGEAFGRSKRSSFSPRRLREILPESADRDWAQRRLSLIASQNPEMLPRFADPAILQTETPRLDFILGKLRDAAKPANYPGSPSADTNGAVAARMIETARMWGDRDRLDYASRLFDRTDAFRTDDDVRHTIDGDRQTPFLGDYLAYADGALQDYLASGRVVSFDRGLRILQRAISLFATNEPGSYALMGAVDPKYGPKTGNPPELADNAGASGTAQMIRLQFSYARVLMGTDAGAGAPREREANALAQGAFQSTGLFARIASDAGPAAAGYFCASAQVEDSDFAVAAGPDSLRLARELFSLVPTRIVAPALNAASARKPGLYISQRGTWSGPFTVAEAAARLHLFYDFLAPAR